MHSRLPRRAFLTVWALALPFLASAGAGAAETATERWYEVLRDGAKYGHSRVVWAPSTWQQRATLHDTTTFVSRSVRNMMGIRDVFETTTTIEIERDDDGTLWWMRSVDEESGRVSTTETTWTGKGYEHVTTLEGRERKLFIPVDAPVMTDSEAFLGARIRAGGVKAGDVFELRQLDVVRRGARVAELKVLAREEIVDRSVPAGDDEEPTRIACFKVQERDPQTGATTVLWLDAAGSYVRLVAEGGMVQERVTKAQAEEAPVRAAEFSVTTPSTPVLERIFSADTVWLDLHLQGDPNRPLPEFPTSPWSRTLAVEGDDEAGWVVKMRLDEHDVSGATTALPIDPEGFERHLEPSVLMPCLDERIVERAHSIVGDEKDARRAAEKLARWVCERLEKQSPRVAQASAIEILEDGRGDCSEHALLFVTLCRAVGIPARQCSGYVCVGSMWGAHAWAEVWLGAWVGADPTTGEVGTGARYVFFGYYDDPDSAPGLVTARTRGRMRFVATRIKEGADDYDLTDAEAWTLDDREAGRYVHVLAGIEARGVPQDWVVRMTGATRAMVRAEGFRAEIRVSADQGFTLGMMGGENATFAGAPAQIFASADRKMIRVHARRRILMIQVSGDRLDEALPTFESVFAPTFAPVPPPLD